MAVSVIWHMSTGKCIDAIKSLHEDKFIWSLLTFDEFELVTQTLKTLFFRCLPTIQTAVQTWYLQLFSLSYVGYIIHLHTDLKKINRRVYNRFCREGCVQFSQPGGSNCPPHTGHHVPQPSVRVSSVRT